MPKKKTVESTDISVEFTPASPEHALETLRGRGYDDAGALSFAKAAKSWTQRDSAPWKTWSKVIESLQAA